MSTITTEKERDDMGDGDDALVYDLGKQLKMDYQQHGENNGNDNDNGSNNDHAKKNGINDNEDDDDVDDGGGDEDSSAYESDSSLDFVSHHHYHHDDNNNSNNNNNIVTGNNCTKDIDDHIDRRNGHDRANRKEKLFLHSPAKLPIHRSALPSHPLAQTHGFVHGIRVNITGSVVKKMRHRRTRSDGFASSSIFSSSSLASSSSSSLDTIRSTSGSSAIVTSHGHSEGNSTYTGYDIRVDASFFVYRPSSLRESGKKDENHDDARLTMIRKSWAVNRRFNEFKALHRALRRKWKLYLDQLNTIEKTAQPTNKYHGAHAHMRIPSLPNRTHLLTGRMQPDFVHQREKNLSRFLQQIVDLTVNNVCEIQCLHVNNPRSSIRREPTEDPRVPLFMDVVMSFLDLEGNAMAFVLAAPTISRPPMSPSSTTSTPSSPTILGSSPASQFGEDARKSLRRISSNIKLLNNLDLEAFFSHYDKIRRRKYQVMEEYELMRQELDNHDEAENHEHDQHAQQQQHIADALDWYQQKFSQMENCKRQLSALRLKGGVFWIEMEGKAYLMNVSSFSQIYIFTPPALSGTAAAAAAAANESNGVDDPSPPIPSKEYCKESISIDRVSGITPAQNTYKGDGWETVTLHLKDSYRSLVFQAMERFELTELIGVHIRSYNAGWRLFMSHLKQLVAHKHTAYDSNNEEHEALLYRLWDTLMPQKPLSGRISKQWTTIGFQGNDPSTDFRAYGLLGLRMLLYMARQYTTLAQHIVRADRGYPFCVSGIQVLNMLFSMLCLDKQRAQDNVDTVQNTATMTFLCRSQSVLTSSDIEIEQVRVGRQAKPFEELFCLVCVLLDTVFQEMNGTYMTYPTVIAETKRRLSEAIHAHEVNNLDDLWRNLLGMSVTEYFIWVGKKSDPGSP